MIKRMAAEYEQGTNLETKHNKIKKKGIRYLY